MGDAVVSTFHPKWRDGHIERAELDNAPGGPADGYACEYATRPVANFTHAPFAIVQAKRLRLQAVTVGSRRDQIDMVKAIEIHGIKPVIDSHFPLENLADAFRHLKDGQHFGKICIDI